MAENEASGACRCDLRSRILPPPPAWSVSTVNRVINDPGKVRRPTQQLILRVAEEIGFYGLGAIKHSLKEQRQERRIGVLLLQENRAFYSGLGAALREAARNHVEFDVDLTLEFMNDLSPDQVAGRLLAIGSKCDSVALVAAEHPLVSRRDRHAA